MIFYLHISIFVEICCNKRYARSRDLSRNILLECRYAGLQNKYLGQANEYTK